MKSSRVLSSLLLFVLLLGTSSYAAVRLPAVVSSHMVLQRNTDITLWGWAEAKEEITISLSWLEEPVVVKANKKGEWQIEVSTTNSKEAQEIRLHSDDSDILLEDVLFGEVWLCSGQSNMEQPVKGYNGQPAFGYLEALTKAKNSNLRLFTVAKVGHEVPLNDIEKFTPWQSANAENVADFSAIAYYFGEQLQQVLDVPVGVIHTSWGGSSVRAWMSKEALETLELVDMNNENGMKSTQHVSTLLYNAMIHPLIPYSIKGALWYQGENNRSEPLVYEKLLPAMVKDWKVRWGLEELPFYYVQIAPYNYGKPNAFASYKENTAFMRESMERCLDLIPNSGMAVTLDIGDATSIHPPKKKEVADRLLYNALSQSYGLSAFDGKSPRYDSLAVKGSSVEVWFSNAERGLYAYDGLKDFEVAGADKVFYPAVATIKKKQQPFVLVRSENVPKPVAVRYAWRNMVEGTLYDANLLPASSFRTDNWDDATRVTIK